jgi:N utilization substance protein A
MVQEIFKQEIPEIRDGVIEIKGLAREAGFRSKVAVFTADPSIDPIGSCIGQRGSRINTIIEELGGEKIDVVQFSDNHEQFVAKALSPAKVLKVSLDEKEKTAEVLVISDQFSLAIGRNGQNVRLASQLTGWKIKVKEEGGTQVVSSEEVVAGEESAKESVVLEEKSSEETKEAKTEVQNVQEE